MGSILNYSNWIKLYESVEPDLSAKDWSEGGNYTWRDAPLEKIIDYTIAKDSLESYSKMLAYMPVMNWFKSKLDDQRYTDSIKDSLIVWLGENPYYGLSAARAASPNKQYASAPTVAVMDSTIRQKMLVEITRLTNEKIANPIFRDSVPNGKSDLPSVISQASQLEFYKDGESTIKSTDELAETFYITMQYPSIDLSEDVRRTISENFFPDDGDKLGQTSVDGMFESAKQVCLEWKKFKDENTEPELQSVEILTFASTSKVNSSYGTGGTIFNQQNNIKLAQARVKVMADTLLDQVKRQSSTWGVDEIGEIALISASTVAANIGPNWESTGGEYEGTQFTVASYGPLFSAAVTTKPTITPKEFYSIKARKENPSIKAEYEEIYSTFRKSTAAIRITATAKSGTTPNNITTTIGQFEVLIQWPDNRKSTYKKTKGNNNKISFKRNPKDTMPIFNGRTTNCPNF